MAKKKTKIKISYDSPVALSFAIVTILLYVLNFLLLKDKIDSFFYAPTSAAGSFAFDFKSPFSYLRLIIYQFGYFDLSFLFADLIIILLLGQILEERYGSVIMGLMMFFSSLFSGVLNACFCKDNLCGAASIVIMMVFLNTLTSISKKNVSFLSILAIGLVICREFFAKESGIISVVVCIAGGLCGSLFAFLASPKARTSSKKENSSKSKAELIEEIDSASPRFKSKSTAPGSDDETVVLGSIEL
ncbi:MAG: rhomboid family intramembrane serine protease [Treponema sp.]|nr:rhomboid family intramembrane serine protease [Treponema sp.]